MTAQPPILAIDIGNTSIKLGEFRRTDDPARQVPDRVLRIATQDPDWKLLESWLAPDTAAVYSISVCPPAADHLLAWLRQRLVDRLIYPLQLKDFPLKVDVLFPARVGQDRLAAAVAAQRLKQPDRAAIVIDAGSAITVDIISPAGDFLGGAILPGWQTMARSLAVGTHLLPLVESQQLNSLPPVVGRSTEQAITSGLFWGSVGAVRELVQRMASTWDPPPDQLLAGGDMQLFRPHLDPCIQSVPDMVLRGIMWSVASRPRNF